MTIRIAAAQTIVTPDISENSDAIRKMLRMAAEENVRLVVFCEGALSGYSKAQITSPEDWRSFDWSLLEAEINRIGTLCRELGIYAVFGSAHPVSERKHPYNSLYIVSHEGKVIGRYDKRFLSNSEVGDWYTPGSDPLTVDIDGYRFGFAICIEAAFPEVFSDYERLDVDAVLLASYGITPQFRLALQASAFTNCLWIAAATPAQKAHKGPAFVCGPEGDTLAEATVDKEAGLAIATLDKEDPAYEIVLKKARPWRRKARLGAIYDAKRAAYTDY